MSAVLGILGGGQLGRMTALAARPLGFAVHVLDPDPACAAAPVVERVIAASFDDAAAAEELARACTVVTLEIEQIAQASLAAAARHAPVRPAPAVLHVVQDRVRQKQWLSAQGFPTGPFRAAADESSFVAAVREFGGRVFAKSSFGGFDGRGQAALDEDDDRAHAEAVVVARAANAPAADARLDAAARTAWLAVGAAPCVVEEALALEGELSVLVARGVDGAIAVYPPARNHHVDRILAWSELPGDLSPTLAARAQELAGVIARELDVVGLLCVEFFHTRDGRLLVNELAPRPHNSYHGSDLACVTGQFEQLVRAVTGLPLGAVDVVRPAAIHNLLGDLWADGAEPAFDRTLAIPGVRLTLYGKGTPRPGRKMGHLTATAATPGAARELVERAFATLQRAT